MRTGLIYKYTNKINGKVYIGQTSGELYQRHKKHLKEKHKRYFDRALVKYGEENFELIILENNLPLEKLDEREIYWIKYYNSNNHEYGYNLTSGGNSCVYKRNLYISYKVEERIKDDLLNTKMIFKDIADKYLVSFGYICDINRGKLFYDNNLDYPLRKNPKHSVLNEEKINGIIYDLQNTNLTMQEIALKYDVKYCTVGYISRGDFKKFSNLPQNINYPIRIPLKQYTWQNKKSIDEIIDTIGYIIYSNLSLREIAKLLNVHYNSVGEISTGKNWKEITNQFILPIRKNREKNQKIFESIYGIVYSPNKYRETEGINAIRP